MRTRHFGYTDTGRRRRHNEDAWLADERLGLFIVCDGVGGQARGEVASEETVELIWDWVKAQAAVADYPEFKGTVAFVGTRSMWRTKEESPSSQAYHWNTNAETYYLIGEAMGTAMVKLCGAANSASAAL